MISAFLKPSIKLTDSRKLTFGILIFLDVNVDTYIDEQFDEFLEQKGKDLVNLIRYQEESLQLTMPIDAMTEFNHGDNTEYFQIWSNNELLKYSTSLNHVPKFNFGRVDLLAGDHIIVDSALPDDGRGRAFLFKFIPVNEHNNAGIQDPMYLVFARSNATMEGILMLIDVVFLLTAIGTACFVGYLVNKIVSNGLARIQMKGTTTNLRLSYHAGIGKFEGRNLIAENVIIYHKGENKLEINPQVSLVGNLYSTGDLISYNHPATVAVTEHFFGKLIFE